jgi:DNA-binding MarR family transcriptional regulator
MNRNQRSSPTPSDDGESLVQAIEAVHRLLVDTGRTSLSARAPGVSPGEFQVLHRLSMDGSTRAGDLASALSMPHSSLTRYGDRLVRQGLITRHRDERNRREVQMAPTEMGRDLAREVAETRDRAVAELFTRLTADQRHDLLSALGRLLDLPSDVGVGVVRPA